MTPGVVLVSHGSREAEGNDAFRKLAEDVKARQPGWRVASAFLDHARPHVLEVLNDQAAAGCSPLAVVPCYMFPGGRPDEDIAHAVAEVSARRPECAIRVAPPLGEHEAGPGILVDQVPVEVLGTPKSVVVLVAAGNVALANRDAVERLAGRIRMQAGVSVRYGYLDQGEPLLADVMAEVLQGRPPFVVVLPCLLFGGKFMRDLAKAVPGWQASNVGVRIYLGRPLAEDPRTAAVVEAEVTRMAR